MLLLYMVCTFNTDLTDLNIVGTCDILVNSKCVMSPCDSRDCLI